MLSGRPGVIMPGGVAGHLALTRWIAASAQSRLEILRWSDKMQSSNKNAWNLIRSVPSVYFYCQFVASLWISSPRSTGRKEVMVWCENTHLKIFLVSWNRHKRVDGAKHKLIKNSIYYSFSLCLFTLGLARSVLSVAQCVTIQTFIYFYLIPFLSRQQKLVS